MLLALAKPSMLTRRILAELLSCIASHSEYLRDVSAVLNQRQDFKVVEYENMCYVFRILEEIIVESDITSDQQGGYCTHGVLAIAIHLCQILSWLLFVIFCMQPG